MKVIPELAAEVFIGTRLYRSEPSNVGSGTPLCESLCILRLCVIFFFPSRQRSNDFLVSLLESTLAELYQNK
jgi:hypothetical protein